jgi:hypothetical protein
MQNIELVTFRTTVGRDRFLETNAVVNDWLKRQQGFVARHLGERDDGSWVDIVFWETHADAMRASEALAADMAQFEAMTAIDPMSLSMSHAALRLSSN